MINTAKNSMFFMFLLLGLQGFAQKRNADFRIVDNYVKSLGALDTLNAGTISYIVTKKFPDNQDKARAIFDWIAYNISFDCKGAKKNGNEKTNSDDVLKLRKTNASGYSALFQDMCSAVKIRCLTVDGYLKNNLEQISEKPDEFNHTWVVVQLGQSAETWFYVDPTLGSGFTDDKVTIFTKEYNDAYFFADRIIFNYQHYPNNTAWLLGPASKNINAFLTLPVIKNAAYEFNTTSFNPYIGNVKTKLKNPVQFSFRASGASAINIVAIAIGPDKKKKIKTVDYTFNGGIVRFSYTFEEENSYPITILVNNKPLLGYTVEVNE